MAERITGLLITDDDYLPQIIADLFCDMTSNDQAAFFNSVGDRSALWARPSCFQWGEVKGDLAQSGREFISDLKEQIEGD